MATVIFESIHFELHEQGNDECHDEGRTKDVEALLIAMSSVYL